MPINNYIIPLLILTIILYGFYKKTDLYESFLTGTVDGLKTVYKIIPTIVAMIFAINVFLESNILNDLFRGLQGDIVSMFFLRPISGNASLAMLNNIYFKHGVDSFYGFVASVLQGCTDTTVYVLALYFGSIKITKSKYALKVGLFADACGITAAFILCHIFFTK